jgi:hypothetical protein
METQQILEMLKAMQEKADAGRNADQRNEKANKEGMLAKFNVKMCENQERMEAKMDANQTKPAKQEEMLAEIIAKMDTNLNEMREDIKSSQAEMRSTIYAFRSELEETSNMK